MKLASGLRWLAWPAVILLLLGCTLPLAARDDSAPTRPGQAKPGLTSFLVIMSVQADLSGAQLEVGRAARGQFVYDSLRAVAEATQAGLRADLEAWGVPYHPFVIVNALQVSGDETLAHRLAARPDVARVVADPEFDGLDDPPPGPTAPPAVDAVEWNIARTNADDVWALGYSGQGIVVGSADTGVDWTHPALLGRYRGGPGDHDYHWYDTFHEYSVPTDPNGHGTHTTGTMVGDDGAGNQVGMAPGAQWIACKADSAAGVWKASKYLECWEWFLAPTRQDGSEPRPDLAPHVINNSWSCPGSEGCDPDTLRLAAQALYAAGIAIAKSGGNSGSACGTITNPGQYPELLATAAFAQGDTIASFSSRGPVTIDGETRIKPDIAAPGVAIRSATPGGGYGSLQGTSMAAPHTAGLIALLWSANPALIGDLDTTFQIVEGSAQPKASAQCAPFVAGGRPNNVWGWGIIDALAAVQAANDTGLGTLGGTVTESGAGQPLPGVHLDLVQSDNGLKRVSLTSAEGDYEEMLLAATYNVTATLYGYLPESVEGVGVVAGSPTTLDLALDPAPVWNVTGHVTDQAGAPLGAALALVGTHVATSADRETGAYAIQAAQGTYVLRAGLPGYVPQEQEIVVAGDRVEDFELVPEATYLVRDNTAACGPAFAWIDIIATGTPHPLADDANVSVSLPNGRAFPFYDQAYTSLFVGSNGYVTFGAGSNYPGGNAIPSTFLPNNAVYAFWDDLNPASGAQGQVYTQLVDENLFVIEFYQVQHFPSGNPETFEFVLDLDTGAIGLQYLAVSDTHQTSVGLENSGGASGIGYSFHDPAVPAPGLAVAFYPVAGEHPAEQGMGVLSGTITILPGRPAVRPEADLTVRAEALAGSGVVTLTADAQGVYSGTLCAGPYDLTASGPGFRPVRAQDVPVYSNTETIQDFALDRTEADLWLTKAGPPAAGSGSLLTYTLSFGSEGPDEVPDALVTDALPPGVTWISGGSYDPGTHTVSWLWFDVLPGYGASVDVVVRVSEDITATELCNTAGIEAIWNSAPLDPDPGDNTGAACTMIGASHHAYLPVIVRAAH